MSGSSSRTSFSDARRWRLRLTTDDLGLATDDRRLKTTIVPMFLGIVFAGAFALLCLSPLSAQRRGGAATTAEALSFRFLGPVVGNRVASIAGIPGDPSIYYAGAASGGVWKTTDGGIRWAPV